MPDPEISSRMRDDWNARAREDAGYYVAFGRRDQNDEEFFATGLETAKAIEFELRRIPHAQRGKGRALEIGCGPGRSIPRTDSTPGPVRASPPVKSWNSRSFTIYRCWRLKAARRSICGPRGADSLAVGANPSAIPSRKPKFVFAESPTAKARSR